MPQADGYRVRGHRNGISMAVTIVKSCVDCAMQLGFPEARIPLAEAVILLATAPKSNSAICAIDAALEDIKTADGRNTRPSS